MGSYQQTPLPNDTIQDASILIKVFQDSLKTLNDSSIDYEKRVKMLTEVNEGFETIVNSNYHLQFVETVVTEFVKFLDSTNPEFVAELPLQVLRKLCFDMIQRLPHSEALRVHSKTILALAFRTVEVDNEDNAMVCLRIISDYHKQFRPPCSTDVQKFLQFAQDMYTSLPKNMPRMFELRESRPVDDINDIDVNGLLDDIFSVHVIKTTKKNADNSTVMYNIMPKAKVSLKLLQEIPVSVVLLFQLFKPHIHDEIANFVPLIMDTINLNPMESVRNPEKINVEMHVDFVGVQVKTISFLAYIIRVFQDVVVLSDQMVQGMLYLLESCPHKMAHMRKELLIGTRHILGSELRLKFVPHITKLFNEDMLLGTGWTAQESMRALTYSTVADLVHHVRHMLSLEELTKAIELFSKTVHDETLPIAIHTMSCKLLLNLVECIRLKCDLEGTSNHEFLMRILKVSVLKFKTIARLHLPVLMGNLKPPSYLETNNASSRSEDRPGIGVEADERRYKFGFPPLPPVNLSVPDCRALVKTLVCGAKTVTWGLTCKTDQQTANGANSGQPGSLNTAPVQLQPFPPKDTMVYIKLVRWAMLALDIYSLNNTTSTATTVTAQGSATGDRGGAAGSGLSSGGSGAPGSATGASHATSSQRGMTPVQQTVRTKEEKEVLEHFAAVFSLLHPQTFKEVFSQTIGFVVERIHSNYALQIIANSFLANSGTSAHFATILVEFLLEKMSEMGNNMERSSLYLKLFKLVFGSVSLFAAENEMMLRPHLHVIVNKSMDLAKTAKEPYNYFLLLRALFRSIGGGSHDLLYQEFLPLLPNLLQGLNSLQSGLHKQHMKDLFVELCLTVPVRLSSLLPYLPMLMDPLVSALNGSPSLISQGLRTLELCVDNLQPEFLYEHIQPVRAELMQALWKTLRNPQDNLAHVAFRVLGKFGGGNRKMMVEPQALTFTENDDEGPKMIVSFPEFDKPITLSVRKVIYTALEGLKSPTTEPGFYRKQCWDVIKVYLVSQLHLGDNDENVFKFFSHPKFKEGPVGGIMGTSYRCSDQSAREVHLMAVTGMFVAAAIKELRTIVFQPMMALVRQYTMVALSQQAGPFNMANKQHKLTGMDPYVLIDALADIMGHEEKELCKPGQLAIGMILETAKSVLGNRERACQLPLLEYLAEKMCGLCYERAWYAKLGGCLAIKSLAEKTDRKFVYRHQFSFLKALLFVMMDLTGEVSSGAVEIAKTNLEKLVIFCAEPFEDRGSDEENSEMKRLQEQSFLECSKELVRQVASPNTNVREQAINLLQLLSEITQKSITEIMLPHKEVLVDIVPPKKHLLRHQPVNAQIGLMEGTSFCTTLNPRLFSINLGMNEHKVFFSELMSLSENDDQSLMKLPCYKNIPSLVPLKKAALRALAASHYIPEYREKIFVILGKALNSTNQELVEVSYDCMKSFTSVCKIDNESISSLVRTVNSGLLDHRVLNLNLITRISYLAQVFPGQYIANEKIHEQLLSLVKKCYDSAIVGNKQINASLNTKHPGLGQLKLAAAILELFTVLPQYAVPQRVVEMLVKLTLGTEKALLTEASSLVRVPLMKYLATLPEVAIDYLLSENQAKDPQNARFLSFIISHEICGKTFRNVLTSKVDRLITLLCIASNQIQGGVSATIVLTDKDKEEIQFNMISVIYQLAKQEECPKAVDTTLEVKFDPTETTTDKQSWIGSQEDLVEVLSNIWSNDAYLERFKNSASVDYAHWKEPKLIVKILLMYFQAHKHTQIHLLFQLLRAECIKFVTGFRFFRDYLDTVVCKEFSVVWKRKAFYEFVKAWKQKDSGLSTVLKGKILTHIIIPSVAASFEKGDGDALIGTPPCPESVDPENIISTFVMEVINPEDESLDDTLRILLLQLSCLLVEQGHVHIHDSFNKKQGNKLRRLMTFAWPCLLPKNCVEPGTRYHGHLLLSHIISKFAIHKRIVLQVFHSLLKAHAAEARSVVLNALDILTPSMPGRMDEGHTMLIHWTRKIIIEEGHAGSQLVHILSLVVRHYKVYYPVRHQLINYIITAIQKLGFLSVSSMDQRKMAADLCETVIRWEMQRLKYERDGDDAEHRDYPDAKRRAVLVAGCVQPVGVSGASSKPNETNSKKPLEKSNCDSIVNFLLKLACQMNEAQAGTGTSPGEIHSRRCVALLKLALRQDMWPNCDLKLAPYEKILTGPQGVEGNQPNYVNICTCLDILGFLLTVLAPKQILTAFKPLQKAIATCMTCPNPKVIRAVHGLMSRLIGIFPTEPFSSTLASKHEELEQLYASVSKVIYEGLANFEKNPQAAPSTLLSTLMMLKAACTHNPCYIDRLITVFMRVFQRLCREHLTPTTPENSAATSELLMLSLDLVKHRVGVMGIEIRKNFIGSLLVSLIEKSPDVKVLKAITKILEDWVKNKDVKMLNQGPSLKEKSILLVKMMQFIEKRFPDDADLNAQFLLLVNYVYTDEALKSTELSHKLEPAFMSGLRCVQPHIRTKFFDVFDRSIKRSVMDRMLYILCSQNWEAMGPHYWIKQCIELTLSITSLDNKVVCGNENTHLPSVFSVVKLGDSSDQTSFHDFMGKCRPMPTRSEKTEAAEKAKEEPPEDTVMVDVEFPSPTVAPVSIAEVKKEDEQIGPPDSKESGLCLEYMIDRQYKLTTNLLDFKSSQFLGSFSQLAHMDTDLAEHTWLELLPQLWSILNEHQREILGTEMVPFVCSGSHNLQKDCHPSSINTFVEAICRCQPAIFIKPSLMKFLGKSHNLWHRSTLLLEKYSYDPAALNFVFNKMKFENLDPVRPADSESVYPFMTLQLEATDALAEMYSNLKEEDMWAGVWQKKAKYNETSIAIAYEQQGFFEQAQGAYELAMTKYRNENNGLCGAPGTNQEVKLIEEHWLRSSKEMNQWEILLDYGNSKGICNPHLVLDSVWRSPPNWQIMKEALNQVEVAYPKEMAWKINLYRGYMALCHPEESHLPSVERMAEAAQTLCIKEWRRLPQVVSHIHLPLLQASQQIVELSEASQIHQGLLNNKPNSLHDMKAIVKTWRNRLPIIGDDLSHWSDIFTWRQHHYQFIASHYNNAEQAGEQTATHSMLGVHASAQAIIHFGKIARKHNLTTVCLESLSRIYAIASVPIVDCFQKIRQQVKCYVQTAALLGKNELQEGLDIIESTKLKYFTKEMTAEFYALKGMLLAQIGKTDEEVTRSFSASVQMHDTLVKAWGLWADYLENIFTNNPQNMQTGIEAVTCYLHACRNQNESKSRKSLAKVIWLLTYDDEASSLAEAVEKYHVGIPPVHWLPWIPQLLTCLVRNEGRLVLNLLSTVGRMFPQAVYFPIRTLYLTLKIEQRERHKTAAPAPESNRGSDSPSGTDQSQTTPQQTAATGGTTEASGAIRATAPMWRCSRIMHMQRDLHPTVLSSLEGIVDQMIWFRENMYEEVIRQLGQGLIKCYALAFDNREMVTEAIITAHTQNFIKKLVATFGIGLDNCNNNPVAANFSGLTLSTANGIMNAFNNESFLRRGQTQQDPVYLNLKSEFTQSFDFSQPGSMKIQNVIQKLKKWIKVLELKTKLLPKTFLIEDKCRFLSNFSRQTAEVELPGELLLPKHSHYQVCIQRFMPRVEIVQKHNAAARRLFIRGHNGKVYPYLIVSDSGLTDARREERVLQLLRMMNHLLSKHKETSRRFLHFTVPRVVAVSPQMRLVEDNVSSLSLLDIYKQWCTTLGVERDSPIAKYYERLATIQARGMQATHPVLREILKEVQTSMIPRTLLRDWANARYKSATDYWTFRKMMTLQTSLAAFAEYVLHLTRLNPDMMYIHQDSGLLNVSYFKFDVDGNGDLDSNRPVPFRLTPNIAEFIFNIGVIGPFTASMISSARCFTHPNFKIQALLRAILRDEMISWHRKATTDDKSSPNAPVIGPDGTPQVQNEARDHEAIINLVTKAVNTIMQRLSSLSTFDGTEASKVSTLITNASSLDNLCRMDPAWHPWL